MLKHLSAVLYIITSKTHTQKTLQSCVYKTLPLKTFVHICADQDSVVSTATCYRLNGLEIEPRWGVRFAAPVQTGPGAHPDSYTIGTRSHPQVKQPGRGIDHPPPSRAEVKERVGLYLYSLSGPSWPVLG